MRVCVYVTLAARVFILLCTAHDGGKMQNDAILQRSDLQAESVKLRGVYRCAYTLTIIITITPDFCVLLGATVFTYSECVLLIDDNSQAQNCDEVLFMA